MLANFLPLVGDEWSFAQINTPKTENYNVEYKIIIRTGFAFIVSNKEEYAVIQVP